MRALWLLRAARPQPQVPSCLHPPPNKNGRHPQIDCRHPASRSFAALLINLGNLGQLRGTSRAHHDTRLALTGPEDCLVSHTAVCFWAVTVGFPKGHWHGRTAGLGGHQLEQPSSNQVVPDRHMSRENKENLLLERDDSPSLKTLNFGKNVNIFCCPFVSTAHLQNRWGLGDWANRFAWMNHQGNGLWRHNQESSLMSTDSASIFCFIFFWKEKAGAG